MKIEWTVNAYRFLVDYCIMVEKRFFFCPSKFMKYLGNLLTYF